MSLTFGVMDLALSLGQVRHSATHHELCKNATAAAPQLNIERLCQSLTA